jgi:uncharacterized protein (DUF302 family)
MLRYLLAACLMLAVSTQARAADDLIAVKSAMPVKETLDRLQKLVTDDGFFVVARVPHSDAAKGAGLALLPTELMIFGKPQSGTPIMVCNQRSGFDLPLRALSWQDQSGQTWLAVLDPQVLKRRYSLGAECDAALKTMDIVVRKFLSDATKP